MQIQNIPESFLDSTIQSPELFVYDFKMTEDAVNIKVNLTHNMFSFLQLGEKKVKFEDAFVEVNNKQSVLIKSGNCLMTELLDNNEIYFCKLLFFTNKNVVHFLKKHAEYVSKLEKKSNSETPFFVIENDDFIHSFVNSISTILNIKADTKVLLEIKLEEILFYLSQKYGVSFIHYLQSLASAEKNTTFKNIVEANINSNLSLIEIAFLANMSLSTFKRHFLSEYNANPGKWLQQKRLALAKHLMENEHKKPSEIHKQFGYNSLSNFCVAFKNEFGFSPKRVK
ncbi:AraC family transcriptional regulator [Fluviicola taffensis]|uniref:helix-turn-helix domain-containing protein n=1 Tax=Fluviicola taffensis TaxID=191579 RepID=UPI0031377980